MPYRRRGSYMGRRSRLGSIIDSNKNVHEFTGSTGTTQVNTTLIIAKDSAVNTATSEVTRGCTIKAIYFSFDTCGLAATGVLQRTNCYLIKNEGANLTLPSPFSVGSSNEKRFVFKQWQLMTMRNQDGNPPFHWEGWIKIPRKYQRFGADDILQFAIITDTAAGHQSGHAIYKWYK